MAERGTGRTLILIGAALLCLGGCKEEKTRLPFVRVATPITGVVTGETPFFFTVTAPVDQTVNVRAEYSPDKGQNFFPATLAAGSPSTTQLQANPEGLEFFFFWDPLADLGPGIHRDVIVRVFGFGDGSIPGDTAPMIVDLSDRLVPGPSGGPQAFDVSATPLPDGSVWIAGGRSAGGGRTAQAFRYDPQANTFAATPALSVARSEAGIALTSSGLALIAGGHDGTVPLAAADALTLDGNAVPSLSSMSLAVARARPAVAALGAGRAVVLGGETGSGPTPDVEVFTPDSVGGGAFSTSISDARAARVAATATTLADGQVLLAGGADSNGNSIAVAVLVDASGATLTDTDTMRTPRSEHGAVRFPDGRVLIAGGASTLGDDNTALSNVEIYDPASGTFLPAAPMNHARRNPGIAYTNGSVVVFGGTGSTGQGTTTAERYDLETGTWETIAGPSGTSRTDAQAVTYNAGWVLVVGGDASAERYVPDAVLAGETFEALTAGHGPRADHTATLLPDQKVFIAGGTALIHSATGTTELFDGKELTFTARASMVRARRGHAAIRLTDGRVLVAGGRDGNGLVAQAEVYDPVLDTWTLVGSLSTPRLFPRFVPANDGRVFLIGGTDASGQPVGPVEEWIQATSSFSSAFSIAPARAEADALLGDGKLVVGPGAAVTGPVDTVEVVESGTLLKTTLSGFAARSGADLAFLSGPGVVVVSGGADTTSLRPEAELLDLRANPYAFLSDRPLLQIPRARHRSLRVGSGVLIVGGVGESGLSLDQQERMAFNDQSRRGTFSRTRDPRSNRPRQRHTVTLIDNAFPNTVLIVGGVDERGVAIGGAELFRP